MHDPTPAEVSRSLIAPGVMLAGALIASVGVLLRALDILGLS